MHRLSPVGLLDRTGDDLIFLFNLCLSPGFSNQFDLILVGDHLVLGMWFWGILTSCRIPGLLVIVISCIVHSSFIKSGWV